MDVDQARESISNSILFVGNDLSFDVTRAGIITVIDGEDVKTDDSTFSVTGANASIDPRLIDGTNILSGDRKLLIIYEENMTIEVNDIFIIDGSAWFVVNPQPVKPTGDVLCWHPILRKGSGSA